MPPVPTVPPDCADAGAAAGAAAGAGAVGAACRAGAGRGGGCGACSAPATVEGRGGEGGSGREGRRLCVTAAAHAWTPDGWEALPGGQVQGPSARHPRSVTGLAGDYGLAITGKQANAQTGTVGQLPATLEVRRW